MKKTDPALVEKIREHALSYPQDTYEQIATTYGVSEISVKRFCAGLGRTKLQRKKLSSKTLADRLWSKVDRKPNQCWLWTGCKTPDGYGFMHAGERSLPVHQIAYELMKGAIPVGRELDHRCNIRACCNPDHLEPVTHRENMERAGIIPPKDRIAIDPQIRHIDTRESIDTTDFGFAGINEHTRSPHINTNGIKALNMDTVLPLTLVSMANPEGVAAPDVSTAKRLIVSTPSPRRADPFSPICTMHAPPELEPVTSTAATRSTSGSS